MQDAFDSQEISPESNPEISEKAAQKAGRTGSGRSRRRVAALVAQYIHEQSDRHRALGRRGPIGGRPARAEVAAGQGGQPSGG
jgi:hypothetical protein